jgi:hypothetical protein
MGEAPIEQLCGNTLWIRVTWLPRECFMAEKAHQHPLGKQELSRHSQFDILDCPLLA